ncbi:MAG: hypothetical protein H7296_08800 [Bacteroidia bacterium]|nr:hypothetical protein [Bacteroidia bacterium]
MRNRRIILILVVILTVVSSTFISCYKPKCKNTIETKNIAQSDKDLIPYKGNEILTFIHTNANDTHIFVTEPNWTSYSNSSFGGADCSIETKREGRGIALKSQSFNYPITLNQYITDQGNAQFHIEFQDLIIETRLLFSRVGKMKDSITIQNKKYYDIYFYSSDLSGTKPTNYGCYYTRTEGIIKLFFASGETWELLKKQ